MRCDNCYWSLYDGKHCQNTRSRCRWAGKNRHRFGFRLTQDEAHELIRAKVILDKAKAERATRSHP